MTSSAGFLVLLVFAGGFSLALFQSTFECEPDLSGTYNCTIKRYPYPTDCTKYYVCEPTCNYRVDTCVHDKHYAAEVRECEDPEKAQCEVTTTPGPTTEPPEFECPRDVNGTCVDGRWAYPYNCSQYYSCWSCFWDRFDCPDNTKFDPEIQECIDESLSDCWESTTVGPITPLPRALKKDEVAEEEDEDLILLVQADEKARKKT